MEQVGRVVGLACLAALALLLAGLAKADPLRYPAMQPQEESQWCWAAAMQNVLAQFGIDQTQAQIVERASGGPLVNESATAEFVTGLVRSYGLDAADLHRTLTGAELAQVFRAGGKIIADTRPGVEEHAVVFQGIDDDGLLVVSDPYTGVSQGYSSLQLAWTWHWLDTIVVGGSR